MDLCERCNQISFDPQHDAVSLESIDPIVRRAKPPPRLRLMVAIVNIEDAGVPLCA